MKVTTVSVHGYRAAFDASSPNRIEDVIDEIRGLLLEGSDEVSIVATEMTNLEFEALPEFQGY